MSAHQSWLISGLVLAAILLLLAVVMIFWKRLVREASGTYAKWKSGLSSMKRTHRTAGQRPMMEKPKPQVKSRLPWFPREKGSDPETPKSEEQILAD